MIGLKDLLQALVALPSILVFVAQLVRWLKEQFGDNWASFVVDSGAAFKKLNEAKTPEQKQDAAKTIQDLIHRL